jgi:hypothetical protein
LVTSRAIRLGLFGLLFCGFADPALACPCRHCDDPVRPIRDDPSVDSATMSLIRITLTEQTADAGGPSADRIFGTEDMLGTCPLYGARRMFCIHEDRGRWWQIWIEDRIHYYVSVPTQHAEAFRSKLHVIFRARRSLKAEVSEAPVSEVALRVRGVGVLFEARVPPWWFFNPGITEPLKAPNGVFDSVARLSTRLPREHRAEFEMIEKRAAALFPSLTFEIASDAWPGYLAAW